MREGLGRCVAEYKFSGAGYAKLVAIMVACGSVGGGMIWLSVTSRENLGGRIIFFVLGLLFLMPVALGLYGLTKGTKNAVRIHERGVAVHKGGEELTVSFDDVDSYDDGNFLVITTRDDESIEAGLGGLANAEDLFRRLREEVVVKRQLAEVRKVLEDGGTGDFGGYVVGASGVTVVTTQRRVAWNDLVEIRAAETPVAGSGRLRSTAGTVVLRTSTETFEAVIEPRSERELLVALCDALKL